MQEFSTLHGAILDKCRGEDASAKSELGIQLMPELVVKNVTRRHAKSGGGPPHSKTLRAHEGHRHSRQRLECGGFSTAFARAKVFIGSVAHRPYDSGGERAALQTLREVGYAQQACQRLEVRPSLPPSRHAKAPLRRDGGWRFSGVNQPASNVHKSESSQRFPLRGFGIS